MITLEFTEEEGRLIAANADGWLDAGAGEGGLEPDEKDALRKLCEQIRMGGAKRRKTRKASTNVAQGADPSDAQIESLCESHGLGPSVGKLVVKDALKRWGSIEPAQPALTDDARDAFILDIAAQTPEKPDYWSSCGQCEHNIERAQDLLDAAQSASESEGK